MRVVLQRVLHGSVAVDGEIVGRVQKGYVALVGIAKGDVESAIDAMAQKVAVLRVFEDEAGKMNKSLLDIQGGCLVVSQFTLIADTTQGRRPFFGGAEAPERARVMCDRFVAKLREQGVVVETGRFAADMKVELVNDGPVTIVLDG
jgi:D-tyrosyl-tRNA(Tyr) deacylase